MNFLPKHLLTVIGLACCLFSSSSYAQPKAPCVEMTLVDLKAIYQELKGSTAAAIDSEHTRFASWLEEGYNSATLLAKQTSDFNGYEATLKYYIDGFRDEHVSLQFHVCPEAIASEGSQKRYELRDFMGRQGAWISIPSFHPKRDEEI